MLANMDDSASKALKEYEQILTGGSGKMGRNLNKETKQTFEACSLRTILTRNQLYRPCDKQQPQRFQILH
jgi:hypothetical protein